MQLIEKDSVIYFILDLTDDELYRLTNDYYDDKDPFLV